MAPGNPRCKHFRPLDPHDLPGYYQKKIEQEIHDHFETPEFAGLPETGAGGISEANIMYEEMRRKRLEKLREEGK